MPLATLASSDSRDASDEEREAGGSRTPRRIDRQADSGHSSPRARRSSTIGEGRRASTATITQSTTGNTISRPPSVNPSRTLSTPGHGYGATHQTPGGLAGLGLGNPEHLSKGRNAHDSALSSPRRISTSQPPAAIPHRSPASMLHLPAASHGNYYAASQPGSTTTPRFRDMVLPEGESMRPEQTLPAGFMRPSLALPSPIRHRRTMSSTSALFSPVAGPASPTRSIVRTLRKTASTVGLSVGRTQAYDAEVRRSVEDEEANEDDDVDEGMKANGTRVWYRSVEAARVHKAHTHRDSSFVTIDWMHDAVRRSAFLP